MKLYFIRHGQTDWNEAGKIQGSCDIDLNSNGLMQAEALCSKLLEKAYPITKIYSSKQKRALQTATIIGQTLHIEPIAISGLEEVNLGHWEGLSWSEIMERYPTEYEEWYQHRRYSKPHQGESYEDVVERALAAIHTIIKENDGDVAVVTHNAVIMSLQCYLTNTPFDQMKRFKSNNTAVSIIDSNLFQIQ
ncbi:MAG: pspB [Herbinix sp.]|nr:pspB [Herbinix sp.]